jgi:hypothetical protein
MYHVTCRAIIRQFTSPKYLASTFKGKAGDCADAVLGEIEQSLLEAVGELERIALTSKGTAGADPAGTIKCIWPQTISWHATESLPVWLKPERIPVVYV